LTKVVLSRWSVGPAYFMDTKNFGGMCPVPKINPRLWGTPNYEEFVENCSKPSRLFSTYNRLRLFSDLLPSIYFGINQLPSPGEKLYCYFGISLTSNLLNICWGIAFFTRPWKTVCVFLWKNVPLTV